MDKETLGLIRLLLARLERISADSYWAHRASGIRLALLRILDQIESEDMLKRGKEASGLIKEGFYVLEMAARDK